MCVWVGCRFLDLGGKEKEGVHTLAESYVGLPHVLNVMIEWLHVAGMLEFRPMCEDNKKPGSMLYY